MTTGTSAPTRRGWTSRRIAAILAGGLVLGVGAAVTLAAWNDSEFAKGTFTAGTFNLQGSTDGSTYTDHTSVAGAAAMTMSTNASKLSPGDVAYSPFAVELTSATTNNAVVTVTSANTTGDAANYTYTLFTTGTFGCSAASTPVTTLVPAGTALTTTGGTAPTFSLTAATTPAPTFLCFKVTAGTGITQGATTTATWQFAAVSQ
jgi:predicted ribosomally synthesized peptide with SipW-like signal peptide